MFKSNSPRVLSALLADLLLHLAAFLGLLSDSLILWIVHVLFYLRICFPLMPTFFHLLKTFSPLPAFRDQLSL